MTSLTLTCDARFDPKIMLATARYARITRETGEKPCALPPDHEGEHDSGFLRWAGPS